MSDMDTAIKLPSDGWHWSSSGKAQQSQEQQRMEVK